MADSVPGPDVIFLVPPAEGVLTSEFERYNRILNRLPVPYAVDGQKKATRSSYSATTLTPTSGLIATVLDVAKFDIGLKNGIVMQKETLATAWRRPAVRTASAGSCSRTTAKTLSGSLGRARTALRR